MKIAPLLALFFLLLASCGSTDHAADPWALKEAAPAPLGCEEWRARDPKADC